MVSWKHGKKTKTNFHGQILPCDMYFNATAISKIDSVIKQGKNYHTQTYVEECKYTDAENKQFSMLSDDNDEGCFEV